jgi:PIN domain nuclease of toxin-antitoxin system
LTERLLLDTCAVIWLSRGDRLTDAAVERLDAALAAGEAPRVSPMTAWELGLLSARGRVPVTRPPLRWFEDFVQLSQSIVEALTPAILVAASYLPVPVHNDPVDRILIATARENGLTIVTRDRAILAYGERGHVRTLAC